MGNPMQQAARDLLEHPHDGKAGLSVGPHGPAGPDGLDKGAALGFERWLGHEGKALCTLVANLGLTTDPVHGAALQPQLAAIRPVDEAQHAVIPDDEALLNLLGLKPADVDVCRASPGEVQPRVDLVRPRGPKVIQAVGRDRLRPFSEDPDNHGHVVRSQAPPGVLGRPDLAQVEPAGSDVTHGAHHAIPHGLAQRGDTRVILEDVTDGQLEAAGPGSQDQPFGAYSIEGKRLFDKHVPASLEDGQTVRHVQGHGGRKDHGIDVGPGQQVLQASAARNAQGRRHRTGAFGILVPDTRQHAHAGKRPRPVPAPMARADERDARGHGRASGQRTATRSGSPRRVTPPTNAASAIGPSTLFIILEEKLPEMPRQRTYSPSRLAVFQTCRAQYRYRYVLGIRTPPGPRATFGANLHRTLHQLHLGGGAASVDAAAARQHLEATWSSAGFASAAASAEALGEARDLLDRYHARWGGEATTPVLLERRLTAPYREHTFLGILDRVDRQAAGLVILDYKSGRAPEHPSATLEQQLAIYHHLVRVHLDEVPVAHRVHYLTDDVRRDVDLSPERVTELLDRAHETAGTIEAETAYTPQPGPSCSNCDFTWRCRRDHPGVLLPS